MPTLAKDFLPSADTVKAHMQKCKVCTLDPELRDGINEMLLRNCTDGQAIKFADENGATLTPETISNHKKYLPFVLSPETTRWLIARAKQNIVADVPSLRITAMEARVAELHLQVQQAQEEIKKNIWGNALPALIQRIAKEADAGVVPLKDLAYAMDIVLKNGLLLQGEPTGRVEVTQRDERYLEATLKADPESVDLLKRLYRRRTEVEGISED